MYFASGDSSGVETPDDPFTILVGGTAILGALSADALVREIVE